MLESWKLDLEGWTSGTTGGSGVTTSIYYRYNNHNQILILRYVTRRYYNKEATFDIEWGPTRRRTNPPNNDNCNENTWHGNEQEMIFWPGQSFSRIEARQLSFKLKHVYDVLPCPSNICLWGHKQDPKSERRVKPENLEHGLSSCRIALNAGRYTWRYKMILKELASRLEEARNIKK